MRRPSAYHSPARGSCPPPAAPPPARSRAARRTSGRPSAVRALVQVHARPRGPAASPLPRSVPPQANADTNAGDDVAAASRYAVVSRWSPSTSAAATPRLAPPASAATRRVAAPSMTSSCSSDASWASCTAADRRPQRLVRAVAQRSAPASASSGRISCPSPRRRAAAAGAQPLPQRVQPFAGLGFQPLRAHDDASRAAAAASPQPSGHPADAQHHQRRRHRPPQPRRHAHAQRQQQVRAVERPPTTAARSAPSTRSARATRTPP
jgi:hypothetical protein